MKVFQGRLLQLQALQGSTLVITYIGYDTAELTSGFGEKILEESSVGDTFQFQRKGYYVSDLTSNKNGLVFNKTVGLRDNYKQKPTT